MTQNLKIGDVVMLNSGSPRMTILDTDNNQPTCTWFNKQGELQKDTFHPSALKRIKTVAT
jgi:uncharacterized protein YodC (DUF2158 family)